MLGVNSFKRNTRQICCNFSQYVLSIPVSSTGIEPMFSAMGNLWSDERNRITVQSVRNELMIFFNLSYSCQEFRDIVSQNKHLIKAAQCDSKYHK